MGPMLTLVRAGLRVSSRRVVLSVLESDLTMGSEALTVGTLSNSCNFRMQEHQVGEIRRNTGSREWACQAIVAAAPAGMA
jgi:hypothetical protein